MAEFSTDLQLLKSKRYVGFIAPMDGVADVFYFGNSKTAVAAKGDKAWKASDKTVGYSILDTTKVGPGFLRKQWGRNLVRGLKKSRR